MLTVLSLVRCTPVHGLLLSSFKLYINVHMLLFSIIFHSFKNCYKKGFLLPPIPLPPCTPGAPVFNVLSGHLSGILLSIVNTILNSHHGIPILVDKGFCISEFYVNL